MNPCVEVFVAEIFQQFSAIRDDLIGAVDFSSHRSHDRLQLLRLGLDFGDVMALIPDHSEKSRMTGATGSTTRAAALLGHLQPQLLLIARQVRQATPSSETLGDGVALAALAVLVGAVDASGRGGRIVVGIV